MADWVTAANDASSDASRGESPIGNSPIRQAGSKRRQIQRHVPHRQHARQNRKLGAHGTQHQPNLGVRAENAYEHDDGKQGARQRALLHQEEDRPTRHFGKRHEKGAHVQGVEQRRKGIEHPRMLLERPSQQKDANHRARKHRNETHVRFLSLGRRAPTARPAAPRHLAVAARPARMPKRHASMRTCVKKEVGAAPERKRDSARPNPPARRMRRAH